MNVKTTKTPIPYISGERQISYVKKDCIYQICPITYKLFLNSRKDFWKHIKVNKYNPDKIEWNKTKSIETEDHNNKDKVYHIEDLEYIWKEHFIKHCSGLIEKDQIESIIGIIDKETYELFWKVYKSKIDIHEAIYLSKNKNLDENIMIDNVINDINTIDSSEQFGYLSKTLTKTLTKTTKKNNGIYFTPLNIIHSTLKSAINCCKENKIEIETILEPSCGSCEFINNIDKIFSNRTIDGIEYNKQIYESIKNIDFLNNDVNIYNMSFLDSDDKKYDLIIGNPPYFVMKKGEVLKEYHKYFDGRPNIFVIFIIHSLKKLNDKGVLSFVLPKSFCNCTYYNLIREYIYNNFHIADIIDCSEEEYLETEQDTIIFTVANTKPIDNDKFSLRCGNTLILNTPETIIKLRKLYHNTTNIKELGMYVKVGNTVWNQEKDKLKDDDKYTRLIYSGDIKNNKLVLTKYNNEEKKNYINIDGENGPLLIVNRGYGVGEYSFNYCLVDIEKSYTIENHLITIRPINDISKELLLEKYNLIIDSFNNQKTKEFVKIYCCNSAMNTNELQNILPIYK